MQGLISGLIKTCCLTCNHLTHRDVYSTALSINMQTIASCTWLTSLKLRWWPLLKLTLTSSKFVNGLPGMDLAWIEYNKQVHCPVQFPLKIWSRLLPRRMSLLALTARCWLFQERLGLSASCWTTSSPFLTMSPRTSRKLWVNADLGLYQVEDLLQEPPKLHVYNLLPIVSINTAIQQRIAEHHHLFRQQPLTLYSGVLSPECYQWKQ